MSDPLDSEQLLTDVLCGSASPGYRAGLLQETLRLARRRRRIRLVRRATPALALVAALALFVGHSLSSRWRLSGSPVTPYTLVRTHPLPSAAWVTTRPLAPVRLIASAKTENVILTAAAGREVPRLSDEELLALAPGPAAIVRFGPHSAELVLVSRDAGQERMQY